MGHVDRAYKYLPGARIISRRSSAMHSRYTRLCRRLTTMPASFRHHAARALLIMHGLLDGADLMEHGPEHIG
jgi:hypothetical protein